MKIKRVVTLLIATILLAVVGYAIAHGFQTIHVYEITSENGFSKNDAYSLSYLDYVKLAESVYDKKSDSTGVLYVFSMQKDKDIALVEGTIPISRKEIIICDSYATAKNIHLGDKIKTEKDEYVVTGFFPNKEKPYYYAYVKTAAKDNKGIHSILVEIIGKKHPDEILGETKTKLSKNRISEIYNKINEKINDAEHEKKGIISLFKDTIDTAKKELNSSKEEITTAEKTSEKTGKQLANANKELKKAREELDAAPAKLDKAMTQLTDLKTKASEQRQSYNDVLEARGMTEEQFNTKIEGIKSELSKMGYTLKDANTLKEKLPTFMSQSSNIISRTEIVDNSIDKKTEAESDYKSHKSDGHSSDSCETCAEYSNLIDTESSNISAGVETLKSRCDSFLYKGVNITGTKASMSKVRSRTNGLESMVNGIQNYASFDDIDMLIAIQTKAEAANQYEAEYDKGYKDYTIAKNKYEKEEASYTKKVKELSRNNAEYKKYMNELETVKNKYNISELEFERQEKEYNDKLDSQDKKITDAQESKKAVVENWNDAVRIGSYYNLLYIAVAVLAMLFVGAALFIVFRKKG